MTLMIDQTWKTMMGDTVKDVLGAVVESTVNGQRVVHIGCDSQQVGRRTRFVVVIVLLKPGKGGRCFWKEMSVPKIESLRQRLLTEVSLSIEVAYEVDAVVSEDVVLSIHVDANPNIKFKSSKYVQELAGYVAGQGFNVLTKPDSWAAMHVADHVVKFKNEARSHRRRKNLKKEHSKGVVERTTSRA